MYYYNIILYYYITILLLLLYYYIIILLILLLYYYIIICIMGFIIDFVSDLFIIFINWLCQTVIHKPARIPFCTVHNQTGGQKHWVYCIHYDSPCVFLSTLYLWWFLKYLDHFKWLPIILNHVWPHQVCSRSIWDQFLAL